MRKFFTRGTNKAIKQTLYARIVKRNPKVNIKIACKGVEIFPSVWEKANSSVTEWNKYTRTAEGKQVLKKLQEIDSLLSAFEERGIFDKEEIDSAISDIVNADTIALQKQKEAERMKEEQEQMEKERNNVLWYVERRLQGMETGTIRIKGNTYEESSCRVWRDFFRVLKKYYKQNAFTWNDIDKQLCDDFLCFLEKEEYMKSTINKHVNTFRTIVHCAYKDQIHNNVRALKCFSLIRVQEEDKAKEIFLTTQELQALYEMDLAGIQAQVRDIFLIGCYTCQRFSDYSTIRKENFTTTARGYKVVKLVQEKTNNSVIIPILNNNLLTIAERYNYNLPTIHPNTLNKMIKGILKELSNTTPSLAEKEITTLLKQERLAEEKYREKNNGADLYERDKKGNILKPRYDLVSSHTARRSGITNLYLTGLFDTFQMMSISGHKSVEIFREYIKLSGENIAEEIAKKAENENLF